MATEYHPLVQRYIDKVQDPVLIKQLHEVNSAITNSQNNLNGLVDALQNDVISHLKKVETGKQNLDIEAVRGMFVMPAVGVKRPQDDTRAQNKHLWDLRVSQQKVFNMVTNLTHEEDIVSRMDLAAKRRDLRYRVYATFAIALVIMALYLGAFLLSKYTELFQGFQPPLGRFTTSTVLPQTGTAVRLDAIDQALEPEQPAEPKPEIPTNAEPEKTVEPEPEKPINAEPEKTVEPKPEKPIESKPEKPAKAELEKPVRTDSEKQPKSSVEIRGAASGKNQ